MRHFWMVLTVLPLVGPSVALADRFTTLTGEQIAQVLTGRSVVYADGATQDFRASGATLYNAGRDAWGTWAVRGDQYCSQWPPTDGWTCYGVGGNGIAVIFTSGDDSYSIGTFTD